MDFLWIFLLPFVILEIKKKKKKKKKKKREMRSM